MSPPNPTPLRRLMSEEGQALATALSTLTDRVNSLDAHVAEQFGAFTAELSRNSDAIRDLTRQGGTMRDELASVPDLASHAAEIHIRELREEIAAQKLATAQAESVALRASAERQEAESKADQKLALAEQYRNRNEWIRGVALVIVTALLAIIATHAAWH